MNKRNVLLAVSWLVLLWGSAKIGVGEIFCIVSGICFIFCNLGKREGDSAYSVFNDGFKKLAGEFDAGQMIGKKEEKEIVGAKFLVKNRRLANKPCPCGSGLKHKKCCFLKKEDSDSD